MKKFLSLSLLLVSLPGMSSVTGLVNVATSIDASREYMTLTVKNITGEDVYCAKLVSKVVFEDPEKYLPQEEVIYTHSNLFLRGAYDKSDIVRSFGKDLTAAARKKVPLAIINKVETILEESECTPATFADYCEFSKKSSSEKHFIETLEAKYERYNCDELAEKVLKDKSLSLIGLGLKSSRGLRYFTRLHDLDLSGNRISDVRELRLIRELEELNLSLNPIGTSFDLKGFTALKRLNLKGSGVSSLRNQEEAPLLKKLEI